MRNLTKENNGKSVTKGEVVDFFSNYNIDAPEYLFDFIVKYNGCSVRECRFMNLYTINNFLPIRSSYNLSIEDIFERFIKHKDSLFSKDLIPFAVNPGGGPFYVSIGADDFLSVYMDLMDTAEPGKPIIKLSDSFEFFIEQLTPDT